MTHNRRWPLALSALLVVLLQACGGGSDAPGSAGTTGNPGTPTTSTPTSPATPPGAPTLSGNTATDGYAWINYRRAQLGLSVLARNSLVDAAASGHASYLRLNNTVTHEQTAGAPGFTGGKLTDRLVAAGYNLTGSWAAGEVISATSNSSGFYQAEELIAAIYHRFVIFEPIFKEIGTGATTANGNYTYFVADLTTVNGFGSGLGAGKIIGYPYDNQTGVSTNFFSDTESPDPVPNQNEVGYPISVHANSGRSATLTVQTFTVAPRGGATLNTRLLSNANDASTPANVAAIVPLAPLRAATLYDVSFQGTVHGVAVTRAWSFTTR